MTTRRFVYDKELDCIVEITDSSNRQPPKNQRRSAHVISDIEPYRTVAADVDGKRKVIGSRSRHREFLARNGFTEVGNDFVPNKYTPPEPAGRDIKRALEEHGHGD